MSTNFIDQITDTASTPVTHDIAESVSTRIFRATCSTGASTAAKVATLNTDTNKNFTLAAGVRVAVTFQYGNSATTPTLRVDGSSTGTAKTIAFPTAEATRTTGNGTTYNTWGPYETVIFTYDGTYWVHNGSALAAYRAYDKAASSGSGTITGVTTSAGTHTTINVTSGNASFNVPTKTSHLTNDSGFVTTDEKLALDEVTSNTTYYPIVGTGTTAATRQYDTTGLKYVSTSGTTNAIGNSTLILGNTTASGTAGNKLGQIDFYGASQYKITLKPATDLATWPTADRTITLPDKSGRIALTADLPSITLNGNSTTSPSFYAPTSAGTANYVLISSGSGAPTWTSASITDEKLKIETVTSGTTYYPLVATNSTTAATRQYDSTGIAYKGTNGTANGTNGEALLTLGNSTASTTTNWKAGKIFLYSSSAYGGTLVPEAITSSNKTWTLPNKTGTIALTDDIPDVSDFLLTHYTNGTFSGTANWNSVAIGTGLLISGEDTSTNYNGGIFIGTTQMLYSGNSSGDYNQLTIDPISTIITTGNSNSNSYYVSIPQNKTGTVALTSDIPTATSQLTNDSGFVTSDTNTTYTLTNALSSHKFTWTFTAGGSGSGSTTTAVELAAGTGITLTDDTTNKKITIASSVTNTDEKVKLTSQSTSGNYPIPFGPTSISSGTAYNEYYDSDFYFNPNGNKLYVSSGTNSCEIYMGLGTSESLYTAISNLGWTASVIE